jgi:hypothetical protein
MPLGIQGDVTVQNDVTNPVPVFNVDRPSTEPFQMRIGHEGFGTGSLNFSFTIFGPVPEGMRLMVTHASYLMSINIDLPADDGSGYCTPVATGDLQNGHSLPVSTLEPRHGVGFRRIIGASPITLFVEAGEEIRFKCVTEVDSVGGSVEASISGHFVAIE